MAIQAARCSGTDTDKALLHHCVCSPDTRSIASWLLPVVPVLLTSTLPCAVCVCVQIMSALARLLPRAAFGQLHYRRGAVSRHTSRTLARAWEA